MPATILFNGPIYTLDSEQPQARALGIRDGRIVAVGSEGKVQAALGGRATLINLRGRAVIPALTDAHVHLTWYALGRREIRLDGVADFEETLRRVGEHAAASNAPWLTGGGWDHGLWGGRWPTATDLDTVVPDRPVFLYRRDSHSAWVNSRALAIAGIDDTTPDPPGGSIRRERGKATGVPFETAINLVSRHIPTPGDAERLAALREVMAEAHRYGMAGVHIPATMTAGDSALTLRDLQRLREAGELRLRCLVHLGVDALDDALRLGLRGGFGDRWLRIGGVKMFADGTLGSETAEMLSHYEGRRHLGGQTMSTDELNAAVARAIAGGLPVAVHAIGDAANRRVLDAVEAALRWAEVEGPGSAESAAHTRAPEPRIQLPNRIEHAQIVHPHDLPRFAKLGVVASMQPLHAVSDMETAERLWGERCATAYAWRSLRDAGAILAFGSDAPIEPLNPWLGVRAAVTRQRLDGTPPGGWYPAQRLRVADALWSFAAGPAHAAGAAHELGTLTPGKLADLAVLSADPFKIDPSHLHTITSELTMIEGEIVWEAPDAGG